MSFVLHRSNRMESLVRELAGVVREPAGGPLEAEQIVVQGRGMERWVSMRLAAEIGVWAGAGFPFPRRILSRAIESVVGEKEPAGSVFEPGALVWAVARAIHEGRGMPAFGEIGRYVGEDDDGRRLLALAERIATTFDQYAIYRPDLLARWERGEGSGWQPVLWRTLVDRYGHGHPGARIDALVRRLRAGVSPREPFPRRLSLFGVSVLPPLYLEAFAALAAHIDVHLFLLSPSAAWWADIRSRREILRRRARDEADADEADLHYEIGNPLLASLGRLGRHFQELLEGTVDYVEPDGEGYDDPGTGTMLSTLQADVLALRHRIERSGDAPPIDLADVDGSVVVHSCHGPMREVEVLHDQLLDLFERRPDLEPRDVVVMSPDVDTYVPCVEAVFGRSTIPWQVSDRTVRATEEVVEVFGRILGMLGGRLGAAEMLDLLAAGPVRGRFGIEAEDLDLVREWVRESGIRWGVDERHRAEAGQPPVRENTWRFGLDRLLLAHAMHGNDRRTFSGVLPCDLVEGQGELLGRFAAFCETLFGFRERTAGSLPPGRWASLLDEMLGAMIEETSLNRDQHRRIREGLRALVEEAARAGFGEPLPLGAVRERLEGRFGEARATGAFLARGVTFCALVPMRSIPFRVVCLLGMSDGAFPRSERRPAFDEIARTPRRGDRSRRDDDRYLFLEAILSARDELLITYVGRDVRDDSELPPSVVVSELLDQIGESFRIPGGNAAGRVVVQHPLQPFSHEYFSPARRDPRLFSYDHSMWGSARSARSAREEPPVFLSRPLPPGEAERTIDLGRLARFLSAPAAGFLREVLGFSLPDDDRLVDSGDPLDLDGLETWKLRQRLLEGRTSGEEPRAVREILAARGGAPQGSPGELLLDRLDSDMRRLAQEVLPVISGPSLEPLELDLALDDGTRLVGVLGNLWPEARVVWSASKPRARREVEQWVLHLGLSAAHRSGLPAESWWVTFEGRPNVVVWRLAEDAREALAELVALYRLGRCLPLPFFPESARAWIGAKEEERLAAARRVWEGRGQRGEREDRSLRLAFEGQDPLVRAFPEGDGLPRFAELAEAISGRIARGRAR